MIKRSLLVVLFLCIAVLAIFFLWRYIGFVRDKDPNKTFLLPRLELSRFEITSMTPERTELTVHVLIKNNVPFSFTADSLQYQIFISEHKVIQDRYKKSITLNGIDSSRIALPITIFNHTLDSTIEAAEQEGIDSVEYRFHGSFFLNFFLKRKWTIDIKRLLPLIHIPTVTAEHIEISSVGLSGAAIQLLVSIENKNIFPLQARDIAYEVSIEDNKWIKGVMPGLTDIHEKSVTDLSIPIKVSFKEVGKTLFDVLLKGSNVRYKLRLTFRVESESDMVKNSNVILETAGSVKSLINKGAQ